MAWVYQTGLIGEAHIRIAVVDDPGMADLCVYLVDSLGMASGDKYWFMDTDKESARTWVCVTGRGMSQVDVCFVRNRGMAGWQRQHPCEGKFR